MINISLQKKIDKIKKNYKLYFKSSDKEPYGYIIQKNPNEKDLK